MEGSYPLFEVLGVGGPVWDVVFTDSVVAARMDSSVRLLRRSDWKSVATLDRVGNPPRPNTAPSLELSGSLLFVADAGGVAVHNLEERVQTSAKRLAVFRYSKGEGGIPRNDGNPLMHGVCID